MPYMEPLRLTPPQIAKLTAQSSTQSVKAQTPNQSLPVQEEPEDDGADEQNVNQEQERDQWTPGGSKYGDLPIGTNQKCVIIGTSII